MNHKKYIYDSSQYSFNHTIISGAKHKCLHTNLDWIVYWTNPLCFGKYVHVPNGMPVCHDELQPETVSGWPFEINCACVNKIVHWSSSHKVNVAAIGGRYLYAFQKLSYSWVYKAWWFYQFTFEWCMAKLHMSRRQSNC